MAQNNQPADSASRQEQKAEDMASKTWTLIFLEGFGRYRGFTYERKPRLDHNTWK
jgi:hypothetical protein